MNKFIYYIVISFVAISCCSINFENAERFKNSVSAEVFNNFSLKDNADVKYCKGVAVSFPSGYEYLHCCGINIDYQFNKKEFDIQLQRILNKCSYHYSDTDSCVVILPDFKNNKKTICSNKYIPIFNSHAGEAPLEKGFLAEKGIDYYVFEYKKGEFLKNEEIKEMKGVDMFNDKTYNHGFSNGAIVDKKNLKVVYFVTIW